MDFPVNNKQLWIQGLMKYSLKDSYRQSIDGLVLFFELSMAGLSFSSYVQTSSDSWELLSCSLAIESQESGVKKSRDEKDSVLALALISALMVN